MPYPVHPACAAWPRMSDAELSELADDIHANGLIHPLVLTRDGLLLDGRNREFACELAGVVPKTTVYEGDDPVRFTVSMNEHRRHMSLAERAFVGEALANIRNGGDRRSADQNFERNSDNDTNTSETRSMNEVADMMGVSHPAIARARAIRRHGTQADVDDVLAGRASLTGRADAVRPRRTPRTAPAPTPRRRISVGGDTPSVTPLTREQVDPTWSAADGSWSDRHGFVLQLTARQRASGLFDTLANEMRAIARAHRDQPDQAPGRVRQSLDAYWLRHLTDPNARSVAKLTEALEYLRPHIAEAEAALARALLNTSLNTSRDLSGSAPEQGSVGDSEVRA